MSSTIDKKKPVVGIFAIQGAVSEHSDLVKKCGGDVKEVSSLNISCIQLRLFVIRYSSSSLRRHLADIFIYLRYHYPHFPDRSDYRRTSKVLMGSSYQEG